MKNDTAKTNTQTDPLSISSDLCKLSDQERRHETDKRLIRLENEFYKYVNIDETCLRLKLNPKHIDFVYQYWKLKRRLKVNKQLLVPKQDEDLMNQSERILNARIKMFIHLRQDMECVRNLCYMIVKREKLKTKLLNAKNALFHKQAEFLSKYGTERSGRTKDILLLKHSNCIYDYSVNQEDRPDLPDIVDCEPCDEEECDPNLKVNDRKTKINTITLSNRIKSKYKNISSVRSSLKTGEENPLKRRLSQNLSHGNQPDPVRKSDKRLRLN